MNTIKFRWDRCVAVTLLLLCIFTFYQSLPGTTRLKQYSKVSEHDTESNVRRSKSFLNEIPMSHDELSGNKIPNVVFYTWCHNRTIYFDTYLSILSAWKMLKPDAIEFYTMYDIPREQDKYNFWLEELEKTIPGFVIIKMPNYGPDVTCGVWFGIELLLDRGGLYFADNLVVLRPFRKLRKNEFEVGTTDNGRTISFIMSTDHNRNQIVKLKELIKFSEKKIPAKNKLETFIHCEKINQKLEILYKSTICGEIEAVNPVNIMYTNTTAAARLRNIFYNDPGPVVPTSRLVGSIPKIVHLVWFNKKQMSYIMYLSLRSTLTILKPDKVYIHGDGLLEGPYTAMFDRDKRVEWVMRERPRYIYGKDVLYTQHKSDVIRADVLRNVGGIYMDWDVLWLRPIDDLLNAGYDAIVNFDHMPWPDYPDTINMGVVMAKPGSDFITRWQQALVNYRSLDFHYNAILLPYKIYEFNPRTVHIERKLQVMCYQLKCHPTFSENYKNYNEQQPFDWQKDAYSIHFTYPDPTEFDNENNLRRSTGMFAEIGQYILNQPYEYDNHVTPTETSSKPHS